MAKAKGRDARLPYIKFYTRDWRSNAKLRMCSYASRGLWIDLITLMAESPSFGFLLVNNVVPTCKQLAGLLGGTDREIGKLLDELGEADVYNMTGGDLPDDVRDLVPADMPGGVIFSRRMLKDKAKADKAREDGKGGGNPALRQTVNPPVIPRLPKMSDGVNPATGFPYERVNHGVNPPANPHSQKPDYESSSSKISTEPPRDAALVAGGSAPRGNRPARKTSAEIVAELANAKRMAGNA